MYIIMIYIRGTMYRENTLSDVIERFRILLISLLLIIILTASSEKINGKQNINRDIITPLEN